MLKGGEAESWLKKGASRLSECLPCLEGSCVLQVRNFEVQ